MSIWFASPTIEDANRRMQHVLPGHMGIVITEFGDDYLRGNMPVEARTHQPIGILHGGASVVLAETLGSVAANYAVDPATHYCVGQEINANHIRPVKSGLVTGTARPIHLGSRSQVWGIEIRDSQERMVCISRLTIAVVDAKAIAAGVRA
ncbi:MAG TPA: hotdog fold thioesterase [Steroidobacteraceae bacterium]|nr:hotdog fold thioesterase [Steroidobacteraceae bacterium]